MLYRGAWPVDLQWRGLWVSALREYGRGQRYSLYVEEAAATLYTLLGEPAPNRDLLGRTSETRAQETVDNDVAMTGIDLLLDDEA
jgi:hypothetical protein